MNDKGQMTQPGMHIVLMILSFVIQLGFGFYHLKFSLASCPAPGAYIIIAHRPVPRSIYQFLSLLFLNIRI